MDSSKDVVEACTKDDEHDTNSLRIGSKVIISTSRDAMISVEVTQRGKIRLGGIHVPTKTFVGSKYGDVFQLQGKAFVPADPSLLKGDHDDFDAPVNITSDNRDLVDDGTGQTMTDDDVRQMKAEGVHGNEIIEQLTKSSNTFGSKTEFAQKKYISKKKKRHVFLAVLLRPTLAAASRMLHLSKSRKICELRPDSLAMMLSLGNVQAHAQVVACEQCQGLLLGGIADRMDGRGRLLNVFPDQDPHMEAFKHLDLSTQATSIVSHFPLSELPHVFNLARYPPLASPEGLPDDKNVHKDSIQSTEPRSKRARVAGVEGGSSASALNAAAETGLASATTATSPTPCPPPNPRQLRSQARALERQQAASHLRSQADCLLIAAPYMDSQPLVERIWPVLSPGRPFVMFHNSPEPLAEVALWLRSSGRAMRVDVAETWLREHQVLPGRTHPTMNRHGTSGYVLTATKLAM